MRNPAIEMYVNRDYMNIEIFWSLTFNSFVSRYVTIVVKLEKRGARKTQTFRMSMEMLSNQDKWYKAAEVNISPG